MNHYCCVPNCSSWAKKNPEYSFHTFPKAGKSRVIIHTKLGNKELVDRRKVWINNLKIGKKVSEHMRVCSLHFTESDYFSNVNRQRRILKSNSVPTKKLPHVAECEPGPSSRDSRLSVRNSARKLEKSVNEADSNEKSVLCEHVDEENQADREAAETMLTLMGSPQLHSPKFRDAEIQVNTPKVFTLCELLVTDDKLKSFTGVNNFKIFDSIVKVFEKYYKDKRVHRLSSRQRVMLVLTKLKMSLTYVTLGALYNISPETCKLYITEMIPMLSSVLRPLIHFPNKTEIIQNMPKCFDEFQNVRVVLDCTEIFVQSPKCLCCRIRFYSQYKSHMTVKFMTGVSPGGLITFLSKPYGGRASDKIIFEESNIISLLDSGRDAVMVDKGFRIEDICEINKIKLIRPPFLNKQKQLSAEQAILNAKIASARVHIERSNQRLKIFNILSRKLNWNLIPLIEDIVVIISAVTNLSSPILADARFLEK